MLPSGQKLIMSGNEAIAFAALVSGCKFYVAGSNYSGYRNHGMAGKRNAKNWRKTYAVRR